MFEKLEVTMFKQIKSILSLITPEHRLSALAVILMAVITILAIMKGSANEPPSRAPLVEAEPRNR